MKALPMSASLIVAVLWIGCMASAQIEPNNFGWQCGPSKPTNCPNVLPPQNQLPSDLPYTLRMHDTQTWWSQLESSNGVYDPNLVKYLDGYIDSIAALEKQGHPHYVIFTFSHVPCWAAGLGTGCANTAPPLSQYSGAFTSFVEWLAMHQTVGGNIVGQYVQAYEMWNEWNGYSTQNNAYTYWSGTAQELYNMLQPAAAYLKTLKPQPAIIMPSTTPLAKVSYETDFTTWLGLDNFSNVVNWHLYLSNPGSGPPSVTPEAQWANYGQTFLNLQNASSWKGMPFVDSETNFTGQTLGYICPSNYDANDCTGQIARWQLMHDFNGAAGLFWYYGNQTIGNCNGKCNPANPASYDTAYNTLAGYINGATNLTPCSIYTTITNSSGTYQVWNCPFTEGSGGNGHQQAAFVWACLQNSSNVCGPTPSTSTVQISVSNLPYVDYRDLTDTTVHNISTQPITIGALPILLEE
jgi:hypothetical protein